MYTSYNNKDQSSEVKIKEIVKDPVELIVKEIRRMINVKYINLNDMRNRLL